VCLGKIFVLACKECDVIPEFLVEMALYSIPNGFRFADIDGIVARFWIDAGEELDARLL
jgi:hypothetical protein